MSSGGCHCGAVRYEAAGDPLHNALCHCTDCRASSGAPMVGWIAYKEDQVTVLSGDLTTYEGKTGSLRQFCPTCGTGLFFRNEDVLPGIVDVQSGTLDNPEEAPPQIHIQCAERISWVRDLASLPEFERFPSG